MIIRKGIKKEKWRSVLGKSKRIYLIIVVYLFFKLIALFMFANY